MLESTKDRVIGVDTLEQQVMWFVMFESAKDRVIGVDTLEQ
jgi:multisubunit Na+/H+ antiporter MnhF subunit